MGKIHISLEIQELLGGKETNLWIIREIAFKHINTKWGNILHIYTDGSVDTSKGAVGCGIFIPQLKYAKSYHLPGGISIFSAELVGILMALEWISDVQPTQVCILSDSMSALEAISVLAPTNNIVSEIQHTVYSLHVQGIQVFFEWVPSHCGLFGNEGADFIARKAADRKVIDINLPCSVSELKSEYKRKMKEYWQETWTKYNSHTSIGNQVHPDVRFKMDSWRCSRRNEITIRRLRLGVYTASKYLQFLMNKHPNGCCEVCACKDTVHHVLFNCTKYVKQRNDMIADIKADGKTKFNMVNVLGGANPPYKAILKFIHNSDITI